LWFARIPSAAGWWRPRNGALPLDITTRWRRARRRRSVIPLAVATSGCWGPGRRWRIIPPPLRGRRSSAISPIGSTLVVSATRWAPRTRA
jgi:hypothetical protein